MVSAVLRSTGTVSNLVRRSTKLNKEVVTLMNRFAMLSKNIYYNDVIYERKDATKQMFLQVHSKDHIP